MKGKYSIIFLVDDNEIDNYINQEVIKSTYETETILTHSEAKSVIMFLKDIDDISVGDIKDMLTPEIIFLDLHMPEMSGFEFLEEFNKLSNDIKSRCRIVLLSAFYNASDLKKLNNYNFTINYIPKPLSKTHLHLLN